MPTSGRLVACGARLVWRERPTHDADSSSIDRPAMSHLIQRFRTATCAAAMGLAAATAPTAFAQGASPAPAWPSKPVHLVVGFPAGSSPDFIARTLQEPLSKALGQPVIVDNRPGASGN